MMKKDSYWLSYDLGFKGDYEGIYTWLDSVGAVECGDSFAYFKKKYEGNQIEALKDDIKNNVELDKLSRIYLIYFDSESGKTKGGFLFGKRKRAPWEGYAPKDSIVDEEIL